MGPVTGDWWLVTGRRVITHVIESIQGCAPVHRWGKRRL